jgi:hypothetical protein
MSWIPLFFTKQKQWEYEKEWRMVRVLDEATTVIKNEQGDVYLFELPPDCISQVILGVKYLVLWNAI